MGLGNATQPVEQESHTATPLVRAAGYQIAMQLRPFYHKLVMQQKVAHGKCKLGNLVPVRAAVAKLHDLFSV
jgi:hypothetical protein